MERSQCYIGAPNGAVLCVDRVWRDQFIGRLYHSYSSEALRVEGMQLLFELERFYDAINFPYPATNQRTFQHVKRNIRSKEGKEKKMSEDELLSKHGDLGTFIIRVQHRQNISWQGRITWMDKNETIHFRSIWEMIKLIASALDTVSEQEGYGEESWTQEQGEQITG